MSATTSPGFSATSHRNISTTRISGGALQSYAELDGILLGHETYSLVKGEVAAEEQAPIKVKGFAEPIRCYKVLGLYDDLAREGAVIREESDGFKVLLDLQKRERADIVAALEGILAGLKK
jgi:adenylate cyclase